MGKTESSMSKNRIPIVVLTAADPNLAKALLQAIASLGPERDIRLLCNDDDWHRVASEDVLCAFLDAAEVTAERLSAITTCHHLVIFNVKTHRKRLTRILGDYEPHMTPVTELEDFLLTEYLFKHKYAKHIRQADQLPEAAAIHRTRSVDPSINFPLYDDAVLKTPGVTQFFNYLRSGIIHEPRRLTTEYVRTPATLQIPAEQIAEQQIVKYHPCDLADVEARLRSFARATDPETVGCFLIGKKGVGKSTLAYYVGTMEDMAGHVCCVAIDYTLESASVYFLYDRLRPLLASFRDSYEGEPLTLVDRYPQTLVFRAAPAIRKMIAADSFDAISGISPEAERIIEAETDRGFLIRLYCYYEQGGKHVAQVYRSSTELDALTAAAEKWYLRLRQNPRKAFTYYLGWILERVSTEGLESYSYQQAARYLLTSRTDASPILDAFAAAADGIVSSEQLNDALSSRKMERVVAACLDLSLSDLRALVLRTVGITAGGRPPLLLLDNIDQRTSAAIEARVLFYALRLFELEWLTAFRDARAIVAMRDTTLYSQEWAAIELDITKGWPVEHVWPPDLLTILERRSTHWLEGVATGERPPNVEVQSDVCRYLASQRALLRRPDDTHGLLTIITHRHPFNVRDQLQAFARCGQNVLLHRAAIKERRESDRQAPAWSEISYEYFLRVFLLGDSTYFHERECELPNIYDNGHPASPFNACLRGWILRHIENHAPITSTTARRRFSVLGVPEDEVADAFRTLTEFHLVRLLKPDEDQVVLSVWGRYFLGRIAFDLPYISTIWWATYMLAPYALGEPHELRASELRSHAARFMRWLRTEEELARKALNDSDVSVPDLFEPVTFRIYHSLQRIESSI